jgi:hypothetical protein
MFPIILIFLKVQFGTVVDSIDALRCATGGSCHDLELEDSLQGKRGLFAAPPNTAANDDCSFFNSTRFFDNDRRCPYTVKDDGDWTGYDEAEPLQPKVKADFSMTQEQQPTWHDG